MENEKLVDLLLGRALGKIRFQIAFLVPDLETLSKQIESHIIDILEERLVAAGVPKHECMAAITASFGRIQIRDKIIKLLQEDANLEHRLQRGDTEVLKLLETEIEQAYNLAFSYLGTTLQKTLMHDEQMQELGQQVFEAGPGPVEEGVHPWKRMTQKLQLVEQAEKSVFIGGQESFGGACSYNYIGDDNYGRPLFLTAAHCVLETMEGMRFIDPIDIYIPGYGKILGTVVASGYLEGANYDNVGDPLAGSSDWAILAVHPEYAAGVHNYATPLSLKEGEEKEDSPLAILSGAHRLVDITGPYRKEEGTVGVVADAERTTFGVSGSAVVDTRIGEVMGILVAAKDREGMVVSKTAWETVLDQVRAGKALVPEYRYGPPNPYPFNSTEFDIYFQLRFWLNRYLIDLFSWDQEGRIEYPYPPLGNLGDSPKEGKGPRAELILRTLNRLEAEGFLDAAMGKIMSQTYERDARSYLEGKVDVIKQAAFRTMQELGIKPPG